MAHASRSGRQLRQMADSMVRIGMTRQRVDLAQLARTPGKHVYQSLTVVDPAHVLNAPSTTPRSIT